MKKLFTIIGATAFVIGCGQQEDLSSIDSEARSGVINQSGDVISIASGETLSDSSASIKRRVNENRLDITLNTFATPSDVYTLWLCGFDAPDQCASNPCSLDELVNGVGESFCQWADGDIARNTNGNLRFRGSSDLTTEVILGDGMDNIAGAELHLVVRTHGQPIISELGAMLTTFNGGCPPNTCTDEQVAIILAP